MYVDIYSSPPEKNYIPSISQQLDFTKGWNLDLSRRTQKPHHRCRSRSPGPIAGVGVLLYIKIASHPEGNRLSALLLEDCCLPV